MGLFGLFGRKKEVELDDNITEGILQFENLNLKFIIWIKWFDTKLFRNKKILVQIFYKYLYL